MTGGLEHELGAGFSVGVDRQERQNVTTANFVQEVPAPRVARVGVRFTF